MISIRKALPEDASTIVDFQIKMAKETENLVLEAEKLMPGALAVFDDASKGTYYVAVKGDEVIGCLERMAQWNCPLDTIRVYFRGISRAKSIP